MVGVETKTMETGIMRMVGLSKKSFILMISLQGIMFTIPAILLGFISSFPFLALMYSNVFDAELTGIFKPIPSVFGVIESLLIGLLIPLVSSIVPIFRVMNQNLNDALNYDRSRVKSIYVEILQ
jgi:ABC-type antimicrobial peptide transport system permease subunit